ncbi:hypothetical protein FA13DRAFT_1740122 [Coprinellus micaceus]|uniref:Uncharacterized protein n=1 Tax=Coprinellus micaceus TaxID=71717 RepID=A0A4Y7SNC0_COPMI|nr:hypothetical protein FA13DRAFT_1740122 [Coprinellus micaceus]
MDRSNLVYFVEITTTHVPDLLLLFLHPLSQLQSSLLSPFPSKLPLCLVDHSSLDMSPFLWLTTSDCGSTSRLIAGWKVRNQNNGYKRELHFMRSGRQNFNPIVATLIGVVMPPRQPCERTGPWEWYDHTMGPF